MPTTAPGRRERRKQVTRDALQEAALRFALEDGLENVRVEQIAEAAGVSPRTYNNYFSSKEQAIVAAITADRAERIVALAKDRPANTELFEAIVSAVIQVYSQQNDSPAVMALITSNRALRACYLESVDSLEGPLAQVILERMGGDEIGQLRARALAASVGASIEVAVAEWLRWDDQIGSGFIVPRHPLQELLRSSLDVLAPSIHAIDEQSSGPRR